MLLTKPGKVTFLMNMLINMDLESLKRMKYLLMLFSLFPFVLLYSTDTQINVMNNKLQLMDTNFFYLNTSAISNVNKFDPKDSISFFNSARCNALISPTSLKHLQLYPPKRKEPSGYFWIPYGNNNEIRIKVDPFNNYICDVALGPEVIPLDNIQIEKLFHNYQMIHQQNLSKPQISFSSKSRMALISTSFERYFIDIYTGFIHVDDFGLYCGFKGWYQDEYNSDTSKLEFVKMVLPGLILSKVEDIPGYSEVNNHKLDNDLETIISPIRLQKVYHIKDVRTQNNKPHIDTTDIVIAYTFENIGGEVNRYRFVFKKNKLLKASLLKIQTGIGNALYYE